MNRIKVRCSRSIFFFYALDFSLSATVVVPETVDVASVGAAGWAAHANDGNFANNAARYFGWLRKKRIIKFYITFK